MTPIAIVGTVALVVLALGWLAVSFMSPGQKRAPIEWIAAAALYLFLVTIFLRGFHWAREAESTAGLIGFGFLCVFFSGGFILSAVNAIRSSRKGPKPETTVTH